MPISLPGAYDTAENILNNEFDSPYKRMSSTERRKLLKAQLSLIASLEKEYKGDYYADNHKGNNLLMVAAEQDAHFAILPLINFRPYYLQQINDENQSAIAIAVYHANMLSAQRLLEAGAKIEDIIRKDAENRSSISAYDHIFKSGNIVMMAFLVKTTENELQKLINQQSVHNTQELTKRIKTIAQLHTTMEKDFDKGVTAYVKTAAQFVNAGINEFTLKQYVRDQKKEAIKTANERIKITLFPDADIPSPSVGASLEETYQKHLKESKEPMPIMPISKEKESAAALTHATWKLGMHSKSYRSDSFTSKSSSSSSAIPTPAKKGVT